MAAVPTFEALLLELRKSFGLQLPKERSKFVQMKKSEAVHKKALNELKHDLVQHLGFSPEDAHAFDSQASDLSITSLKLSQGLNVGVIEQKQLLWLLATHIYVPFIARLAAFWQGQEIMDKGMPAHQFWYLPEEVDGELQLPFVQVWNWLEDLIFDPLNNLENQIYGQENDRAKSKRLGITRESFKRTLSNWKKTTGKESAKLIEDYFSDDLEIKYKGTFIYRDDESLDENYHRAIQLLKKKGFTGKTLFLEIQMESADQLDQILSGNSSEYHKEVFLKLIETRFAQPSNQTLIRYFSMAQAFQNAYVRFGKIIHGSEFDPLSTDQKKNKMNQLIAIYKHVYNLTYSTSLEINPDGYYPLFNKENSVFSERVPELFRYTLYQSICFGVNGKDGVSEAIVHINGLVFSLVSQEIPNILTYSTDVHSESYKDESDLYQLGVVMGLDLADDYKKLVVKYGDNLSQLVSIDKQKSNKKKIAQIKVEKNPISLISVGANLNNSLQVKRAIFHRLATLKLTPKQRIEHYIAELAFLLNNETKFNRPDNAESIVEKILNEAKLNHYYDNVKSDFLQFEAKHELSKGNIKVAEKLFKQALALPDKMSVASNRGEIARDLFALRAANQDTIKGYATNNQESLYRDMKYFGGFDMPDQMEPLKALYWIEDTSLFNLNKIYPSIDTLERELMPYYTEMFELYPAYK